MPSVATGTSLGLYWTGCATAGNTYVHLSTMDSTSITACTTGTAVSASYEFTIDDSETANLLFDTNHISGSNCTYIVDSVTADLTAGTESSWCVRIRMLPDASNIELQNLMLSTAEGDQASGQILRYIASTDASNYFSVMLGDVASRELTDEERELLEQRRREREAEIERNAMLRAKATHRAIHLLWKHLSPSQKRSLKKNGWFDVLSKCGIKYRLLYTLHGNVLRLGSKNKVEQAFCGHMGSNIPIADTLLAQKLLLRHNPGKYEKSANKVNYEHTSWCRPQKQFADEIISALNTPLPLHSQELMPV